MTCVSGNLREMVDGSVLNSTLCAGVWSIDIGFGLRSASGRSGRGMEKERKPAAEPQTEAAVYAMQ
ncbi:MAG: hypothetical protein L0Z50_09750 [Verrucomicrobiales bacterium]|nr:hypothetical protein [Verrucomicrobiales bacterium]